ncbi:hypothetical protein K435DRAFT_48298 [Dendrothele bispora CBS 962.96]|uniref:Uncharacterized protein n=1 Tax=Dendrothele bispora (strain CBS 962.96) TaxID=1314807 RepID=A0A4S8KSB1_DENBC|nr:hypothetical protein K435DRAFT_48298 [Dendrothele bispora CBS 962.96]
MGCLVCLLGEPSHCYRSFEFPYARDCLLWPVITLGHYRRDSLLQKVPSKVPTPKEQWECTKQVLFAHFTVELPTIWLFHPLAETVGMKTRSQAPPQILRTFRFGC